MPGKTLAVFIGVFVLLRVLGACGNPVDSAVLKDQETPGAQDQTGEPSDPDRSGQDDLEDAEDPDGPDDGEDAEDAEDPEDPEDAEDQENGPDDGEGQGGDGEPDSPRSPDGGSDPGNEPESGNTPGSGDAAGEGEGSADGPDAGAQPDGGGEPGSGDAPGEGEGSADGPDAGEQPDDGGSPESGEGAEGAAVLTGAAAVQEYLDGQEENTPENPYRIRVGGIDLTSATELKGLYAALSRYAALDLRGSSGELYTNASFENNPNKARITEIILPPGLHTIAINAFAQCGELVSADLGEAATIRHGAFSRCYKLASLVMEAVREIEYTSEYADGAFHNCDSLVSVSLPGALRIGKRAFNSCDTLATVYAPRVEYIGASAFANCKQLALLTLGETPPDLGEAVFVQGKPELIYVPASSVAAYKTTDAAGWTDELREKVQALP